MKKKPKKSDIHKRIKLVMTNVLFNENVLIPNMRNPAMKRKNRGAKQATPNVRLIKKLDKMAPIQPDQFFIAFFDSVDKFQYSWNVTGNRLWSPAPVEKKEMNASNMYMQNMRRMSPVMMRVLSSEKNERERDDTSFSSLFFDLFFVFFLAIFDKK